MGVRIEKQVFNNTLANVEEANRDLIIIYERAQEEVEKKIARLKLKFDKGLLNETQRKRLERLEAFSRSILEDLKILKRQEMEIIINGFTANYANGYYGYGYSISNDVNRVVLKNTPYDYSIGFRKLNLSYVRNIYMQDIASQVFGLGIKDRIESEILALQREIKLNVTQALIEGVSPREAARRLKGVDEVFEQNLNHAFTVARTELLRGHSFGTEDAINTAIDAGVDGKAIWDATLDGFTRKSHRQMDTASRAGEQPNKDGLFVFGLGDAAVGPRMPGLSAKNSINCRCTKLWLPFGLTPNTRGERLADGTWNQVNFNMTYDQWSQTLQGKRSIEAAETYRRKRANRLARLRRKGKRIPVIETITKRT